MVLIKIKEDYYVVVDDSEIKEGDFVYDSKDKVIRFVKQYLKDNWIKKITHSTQPLEEFIDNEGIRRIGWTNIKVLELSEVKELIGEVDVEKKANQALEDNKDKKYTEEDMIKVIDRARNYNDGWVETEDEIIQSLHPKTEWEVQINFDGKLELIK